MKYSMKTLFLLVILGSTGVVFAGPPPGELRRQLVVQKVDQLTNPRLEVHFLDVGQGDSALVRTADEKAYLIDCGPRKARKKIIPYLNQLGVTRLDGIFVSHSHMDHMGGLPYIVDAFPVTAVYFSGYVHTSKFNQKVLKKLKKKEVRMVRLKKGDTMDLGGKATLKALHPPESWDPILTDVNDYSVVLRLSLGEIDFLFMGDAERKTESEIIKSKFEIRSEFLKVGHHGSKTASSELFLDSVLPVFASISCGAGNRFDHPDSETITALQHRNITILRTDENGTVLVLTDGKKVFIKVKGKTWTPVSWLEGRTRRMSSRPVKKTNGGIVHAC